MDSVPYLKKNIMFNSKSTFIITALFAVAFVGCQKEESITPLSAEEFNGSVSLRESHDLCFLSYNIHAFCEDLGNSVLNSLAPDPLTNSEVADICEGLINMDSDVINLQEVWCESVKDAILSCLSSAGYTDFLYDSESGLLTISKLPLNDKQSIHFNSPEAGADKLKNKGFLSSTIELEEDCDFNILNTHLQADIGFLEGLVFGSTSQKWIRSIQLSQIKAFLNGLPNCTPSIIGGDFNIDVESDEFDRIVDILPGQPTFIISGDTYIPKTSDGGSTLDYFFLSNFSSYYSNLSNTTVTSNCLEFFTIQKFNLFKVAIFNVEGEEEIIFNIGTYDTMAEAEAAKAQEEGNNPLPLFSYYIETENIHVCTKRFDNPSDHNPIETCFTYDCEEQKKCNEPPVIIDPPNYGENCIKDYHCLPGEQCINGHCIPF